MRRAYRVILFIASVAIGSGAISVAMVYHRLIGLLDEKYNGQAIEAAQISLISDFGEDERIGNLFDQIILLRDTYSETCGDTIDLLVAIAVVAFVCALLIFVRSRKSVENKA